MLRGEDMERRRRAAGKCEREAARVRARARERGLGEMKDDERRWLRIGDEGGRGRRRERMMTRHDCQTGWENDNGRKPKLLYMR